jgi:hypothetical protein
VPLKGGHGSVDMRHAIEKSCNVYFYTLGNMLGVDRIHKWATLLGLGERSGIDLPNELKGLVPSTEWKKTTREPKWYPGETISVSIGQGQVSVTPISLAVMMMTIANGGTRFTPHVVKASTRARAGNRCRRRHRSRRQDEAVDDRRAARRAVDGRQRRRHRRPRAHPRFNVAGKTGTAQVISLEGAKVAQGKMDLRDHGWFVFLRAADKPEIAGVIFAEHAEHGYLGAPIAQVRDGNLFRQEEGRPLPTLPPKPARRHVCRRNARAHHATRDSGSDRARRSDAELAHVRAPPVLSRRLVAAGGDPRHHGHRRAMIYSTTYVHVPEPGASRAAVPDADLRHRPRLIALLVCLAHRLPQAGENSLIIYVRLTGPADLRAVQGLDPVQRHALDRCRPFNLQPSEFARVTLALVLAMFFRREPPRRRNPGDLSMAGRLCGVAVPPHRHAADLGHRRHADSGMLRHRLSGGLRMKLIASAIAAMLMAPVAWSFALKDYQKTRITTFINPELDPQGDGYQQRQARITVGSGGLTAKGS